MSRGVVSTAMDALVVPGFSRIGHAVRSRLHDWQDVSGIDMTGRVVVITGPTSGLGRETARMLAPTGARLVLVGRDQGRCDTVAAELRAMAQACDPVVVVADMGDLSMVARASRTIAERFARVDVLVHNAGALSRERVVGPQGIEGTIATHVVGPHLMTTLLRDNLRAAHGRVITVSSGGMYAAALPQLQDGGSLEMPVDSYDGTRQYAIAKRAQVALNRLWAEHEPEVEFASMHPGWADTPGVQESIPLFRAFTRPILRTPREGADTIAWLAVTRPLPANNGSFWSDREPRGVHRIPSTRKSDNPAAREALWSWCHATIEPYL